MVLKKITAVATALGLSLAVAVSVVSAMHSSSPVQFDPQDAVAQDEELQDENNGRGHEACSEATQHALEIKYTQLEAGQPVEDAIAAIEACGTGNKDDAEATEEVEALEEGDNPGNGHESCSEATQHALDKKYQQLEAGLPVGNAIRAIENCGTGNGPHGPDGEKPGNGPPDGVNRGGPPAWAPGPPPWAGGEESNGDGPPEGVNRGGPPDWAPGPPPWAGQGE